MSAVFTLLLGASIERFSPLSRELRFPPEATQQQQVPFRKGQPVVTVLAHGGVGTKPSEIEPNVASKKVLTQPIVVPRRAAKETTTPAWAQKTIANRRSAYDREANLVAPNTVVRYDPLTGARLQLRKQR